MVAEVARLTGARAVYLSAARLEGAFSDNYFDLQPGRETRVEFRAARATSLEEFRVDLRVRSLTEGPDGEIVLTTDGSAHLALRPTGTLASTEWTASRSRDAIASGASRVRTT